MRQMSVYVDRVGHLASESIDDLHDFARRIGLKREWFQNNSRHPHYDITARWRFNRALDAGAILVSSREIVAASNVAAFPYTWYWRRRHAERKGQPCRVVCRGTMNSILVEFPDGFRTITSRWAVRKRGGSQK